VAISKNKGDIMQEENKKNYVMVHDENSLTSDEIMERDKFYWLNSELWGIYQFVYISFFLYLVGSGMSNIFGFPFLPWIF
tara:strand:- start:38 stop:277 length:240 start_codon:yes stop_codon:yes gene_type:complete